MTAPPFEHAIHAFKFSNTLDGVMIALKDVRIRPLISLTRHQFLQLFFFGDLIKEIDVRPADYRHSYSKQSEKQRNPYWSI